MRTLVCATIFASVWMTTGHAQEDVRSSVCPVLGELAESVMNNRQNGVSLSDMMGVVNGSDSTLQPVLRDIVLEAYDSPRYSVPDNQREAVQDFRNDVELVCYQGG